jgi:hypothetical protein
MQDRNRPDNSRYFHDGLPVKPKEDPPVPSFLRSKPKTPNVYAKHVVHGKDEDIVTITHTVGGTIRSDTYTRKKKKVSPGWEKAGNAVALTFQVVCVTAFIAFVVYVLFFLPK